MGDHSLTLFNAGIDAGGTLIKFAVNRNGTYEFRKFPASQMDKAVSWVNARLDGADINLTGGRSANFGSLLGKPHRLVPEFDATCQGIRYLLSEEGISEDSFILCNVGTGTSIHHVKKDQYTRVGGTGVGGGTIMGLSYLLTGMQHYEEIVESAKRGKRDNVDLTVGHIYEGSVPPIAAELTASNFGHPNLGNSPAKKEDLLASVIGMVGETVSTASVLAAAEARVSRVVYIGSSFVQNEVLRDVVAGYTKFRGAEAVYLPNGEFSGAIGAARWS
ncbi:type II pantothenate kinase [Cohnella pontilimi]|uniref:Type II pantothenate kinase n=1 Tax=Cohnella pontilimi TaxID=2564100 RepID=A0A4U0FGD0_9BACL|nr:type II pantothenate kinase [Cohnella pontilimi]TJY43977.1 type II pantothenate kinase [Cohnella pontilimi]